MSNIPIKFDVDCGIPIDIEFPLPCSNIAVSGNAVEIPMNYEAFGQLVERYFTDPNYTIVFDGGDADSVLGSLDAMVLL